MIGQVYDVIFSIFTMELGNLSEAASLSKQQNLVQNMCCKIYAR